MMILTNCLDIELDQFRWFWWCCHTCMCFLVSHHPWCAGRGSWAREQRATTMPQMQPHYETHNTSSFFLLESERGKHTVPPASTLANEQQPRSKTKYQKINPSIPLLQRKGVGSVWIIQLQIIGNGTFAPQGKNGGTERLRKDAFCSSV